MLTTPTHEFPGGSRGFDFNMHSSRHPVDVALGTTRAQPFFTRLMCTLPFLLVPQHAPAQSSNPTTAPAVADSDKYAPWWQIMIVTFGALLFFLAICYFSSRPEEPDNGTVSPKNLIENTNVSAPVASMGDARNGVDAASGQPGTPAAATQTTDSADVSHSGNDYESLLKRMSFRSKVDARLSNEGSQRRESENKILQHVSAGSSSPTKVTDVETFGFGALADNEEDEGFGFP